MADGIANSGKCQNHLMLLSILGRCYCLIWLMLLPNLTDVIVNYRLMLLPMYYYYYWLMLLPLADVIANCVGMMAHWKHLIANVLQYKCSASIQSQLIKDCISPLCVEWINVFGVIFDGTFINQQTVVQLGRKMKISDLQPWFVNPE